MRFQGEGPILYIVFLALDFSFFLRPAWVFLPLPLFSVSGPDSSAPWGGIHDGFHARATSSDEPVEWARRLKDDGIYDLACSANAQYLGWNRSSSTR
jgi:hypothetical protein